MSQLYVFNLLSKSDIQLALTCSYAKFFQLGHFDLAINTDCACTLPTILAGNIWDSRGGTVLFTNLKVTSGWTATVFGKPMSEFDCIDSDNTHWLFQSANSEVVYGPKYYGFYCIRYTKITDNSYYYYLDSNREAEAENVRIKFVEESIANAGVTISSVCNPTSGPSAEEFHVLVKETDGEFYATKYVTSGSTSYVIIINADSSTSTRFTCLTVSGSSVSSNPGSCVMGQSATARTTDADSTLISLSAYAIDPASPKVVVDIQTPKEKNHSLPPIEKPPLDVNKNENAPLPSITRQ
ncbi:unnamed protein product [Mytilus edulis]|uniref:Uncharacterized protein n=1 Tax=Mytilus edulis TaxID=6550 RepID=A0A8S3SMT5_MYTED|nr:unnamed protein product [Mytilus edulis]